MSTRTFAPFLAPWVGALALALSSSALAQGVEPLEGAVQAPRQRWLSVTLAPMHLANLTAELTGEYRLPGRHSAAGVLGVGRQYSVLLTRVGGQYRYYALGGFERGLYGGGELLGLTTTAGGGTALAVRTTALLGGKYTFGAGFTAEAQVGWALRTAFGAVRTEPLLDLNLGWSF
ncbi:MAG TPA: hypothetical protein VE153_22690 [Myxococcus sp.]|nr:hypothetical protein [Myxococcus sp.]